MITIKSLFLKYVRQYYALYDINLEIETGESVAFIGASESGKTSLMRVLAKLEKTNKGEVYIKDIPLKKINFAEDVNIGFLPSKPIFFENKTVYQNFLYVLKLQKQKVGVIESSINDILIEFNIESLKNVKIADLSLFEKYVVSIARMCFRELEIVMIDGVLDELSPEDCEKMIELLSKKFINKRTTFILSTESEDLSKKLCKRRVYFDFGSIVGDKKRK